MSWRQRFRPREERYEEAAKILSQLGFSTSRTSPDLLAPYLPWSFLPPNHCIIRGLGHYEETKIELFEYDFSTTTSRGAEFGDAAIVIASHPRIRGSALLNPRKGLLKTARRAAHWLKSRSLEERFLDRYQATVSPITERAQILPTSLQEHIVESDFEGPIELRPGLLLYTLEGARFEEAYIEPLLRPLKGLLDAIIPEPAHPLR